MPRDHLLFKVFWLKGSRETTKARKKRQVRRNCWFYSGKGNSRLSTSGSEPVEEKEVSRGREESVRAGPELLRRFARPQLQGESEGRECG